MYSGERILPTKLFNVTYQQSLLAYEFAANYSEGKSVLDVASGEGYGAFVLGRTASRVVGIDFNNAAIEEAKKNYGSDTVSFVRGDLLNAPTILQGELFDVVCCFQTIEHVQDHDAFLNSLSAVTKPGGYIIVSTPNTNMFHSFNPYHPHEVDAQEMNDLFARHFREFTLYGVFGDDSVIRYRTDKQKISDMMLRIDFLKAREWLPGPILRAVYAFVSFFLIKNISFWKHAKEIVRVTTKNFTVSEQDIEKALDFIAVAKKV